MAKTSAARIALLEEGASWAIPSPDTATAEPSAAQRLQLEIAARQAVFERHAAAAGRVVAYDFQLPPQATAPALGAPDRLVDAGDQLRLVLALTGGAIGKAPGGLRARVPVKAAARFEDLARPLIEAYLVAIGLDEAGDDSST